jgi:glutaredoxin
MAIYKAQAMIQERSDISYSVLKLGQDFTREDVLSEFPNARTFPQIKIDGSNIGGWSEFQKI